MRSRLLKERLGAAGPCVPASCSSPAAAPCCAGLSVAMGADEAMLVPSSVGEFVASSGLARIGRTVGKPAAAGH